MVSNLGQFFHIMTLQQAQDGLGTSHHGVSQLSVQLEIRIEIAIIFFSQHIGDFLEFLLAKLVALLQAALGTLLSLSHVILKSNSIDSQILC